MSRVFDSKGDEADRRKSREELIKRGIYKKEAVFGNDLVGMAKDPETGLPLFLARCTKKIEEFAKTEGVYRINGDAAAVQKLRSLEFILNSSIFLGNGSSRKII